MNRLFATALVVLAAGPLGAQRTDLSIQGIVLSADHFLLGRPLIGGAAAVRFSRGDAPLSARFGLERLRGRADRFGVPCAGLVLPGTCSPENVRDEGQVTSARVGVALRVHQWRSVAVELNAEGGRSAVRSNTRGLASARELSATKDLWVWSFGAEARWRPVARVPLAVEVGGGIGGFAPLYDEATVDGYSPFESAFRARSVRVGLAWAVN